MFKGPLPPYDDLRVRAWLEIRAPLERQLEPLGRAAIDALGLAPGERVLDVGCGIGSTPAALARAVGPSGRVVGLDLLAAAIAVAQDDPNRPDNLDLKVGDAQSFAFEPGAFDAVFSRFGVTVFADPVAAFANLARALRPGGRLGFVCWRALAENELDALPLHAASACLPPALFAEAAASGPFSFSDPTTVRDVLARAGFVDVAIAARDAQVGAGSLDETVAVCSRVGALGRILRERPALRGAAVAALESALAPLDGPAGPTLGAATWIVTGRTRR